MLAEHLDVDEAVIEAQLAHSEAPTLPQAVDERSPAA
jgi:hypothetical protein